MARETRENLDYQDLQHTLITEARLFKVTLHRVQNTYVADQKQLPCVNVSSLIGCRSTR